MNFEGTPPPAGSAFRFEKIEGGIWFGLTDSAVSKDYCQYGMEWTDPNKILTDDRSIAFSSQDMYKAASAVQTNSTKESSPESRELCNGCSLRDLFLLHWTIRPFHLYIYTSSFQEACWMRYALKDLFDAFGVIMPSECLKLILPHADQLLKHLSTIPELANLMPEETRRLKGKPMSQLLRRKMFLEFAIKYSTLTEEENISEPVSERSVMMEISEQKVYNRVGKGHLAPTTVNNQISDWLLQKYEHVDDREKWIRKSVVHEEYVNQFPHPDPEKKLVKQKLGALFNSTFPIATTRHLGHINRYEVYANIRRKIPDATSQENMTMGTIVKKEDKIENKKSEPVEIHVMVSFEILDSIVEVGKNVIQKISDNCDVRITIPKSKQKCNRVQVEGDKVNG
ncbi:uncharacterized protein LOC118434829 [Folsomia candida]|uniref:Uncharacterized protein n=1 Tax=Folsomia candida TaxID=158441 RepID=A0A226EJK3_FOLCA|nr:uncharacterized protein LOC118434829 [Folsomia candida]OXA57378.1 hypothetical protein Fcan01_06987 [Folsomia candida]